MTEWQNVPLASLLDVPVRAGIYVPKSQRGRGVPLINMGELFAHDRIGEPPMERVPVPAGNDEKYLVRAGDLLMARLSLTLDGVGKVALVGDASTDRTWEGSIFRLRFHPNRADPRYYYYYFRSHWGRVQLLSLVQQTAAAGIRGSELARVEVPAPPLRAQRVIADTLSALDDKIELNRRMNRTVGDIALALFKSWFVSFDPVRAKADGRDSGLPRPIADLFPDQFEDSELGAIPSGWAVESLREIVDVQRGLSYHGSGLSADGLPMHNLNSIYEGGGYKHDGLKFYTGDYKPSHVARPGDVLVANTEQGHERLLIGFAAVVPSSLNGDSIFSHHLYRVRPRQASRIRSSYLYHLFNSPVMHDIVSGYANGTTVNMLPMDGLLKPLVTIPPDDLLAHFETCAGAFQGRQEVAFRESRSLAKIRDALLPKLVSGQIGVPQVERLLEAVPA